MAVPDYAKDYKGYANTSLIKEKPYEGETTYGPQHNSGVYSTAPASIAKKIEEAKNTEKTVSYKYNPNSREITINGYPASVLADNPLSKAGSSSTSKSSGGGGVGSVKAPDISGLLAAYEQQADASRKIAQSSYDTTRNDLLTSLKRFQEQHALDVQNQQRSYLNQQSALDYAREQANRQNRIAASARGLGGSGLQQLAQLQLLMAQGEDISNAAITNQEAMDALRRALAEREEDTNTSLSKIQTTLDNALLNIESNLAKQKADTIYQNELTKYENAMANARAAAARAASKTDNFDYALESALNSFNAELGTYSGKTEDELTDAINRVYSEKYGNVSNLAQARTVLNSVFTDQLANRVNSRTTRQSLQDAMNRVYGMTSSLQ